MTFPITTSSTHELPAGLSAWLRHGYTCPSALYIAEVITGIPFLNEHIYTNPQPHPRSAYEVFLIQAMMDAVPSIREQFSIMRNYGPAWASLVDNWGRITSQMRGEIERGQHLAPSTCHLITTLVNDSQVIT